MRLLKSVFLTAAFCAFTVTSYAQNVPRGPTGFSHQSDTARPAAWGMRARDEGPSYGAPSHHNPPGSSNGCTAERQAIDAKNELIAGLRKRIQELEATRPLARAGGSK